MKIKNPGWKTALEKAFLKADRARNEQYGLIEQLMLACKYKLTERYSPSNPDASFVDPAGHHFTCIELQCELTTNDYAEWLSTEAEKQLSVTLTFLRPKDGLTEEQLQQRNQIEQKLQANQYPEPSAFHLFLTYQTSLANALAGTVTLDITPPPDRK